jgi:ribonuclease HI
MAKKIPKFYVVWKGRNPGIFKTWNEAKRQIDGFAGADYKSYESMKEAQWAWDNYDFAKEKIKENKKTVYYVVWAGHKPGIFTDWDMAKAQIDAYVRPQYKSFGGKEMAEKAYKEGPENYRGRSFKKAKDMTEEERRKYGEPNELSISVDAACNAKGDMEYRAVFTYSGDEIFKKGVFKKGSNNVGEFLAIVHALAWAKKEKSDLPIYSDSKNAISWVVHKKANTKIEDDKLLDLVKRAENWLKENDYPNKIIKWQTKFWGEIPADFGRK